MSNHIQHFTIKGFKCFENQDIKLNQLTVLAGGNSVGKSTVIQALLLLRSTFDEKETEMGRSSFAGLDSMYAPYNDNNYEEDYNRDYNESSMEREDDDNDDSRQRYYEDDQQDPNSQEDYDVHEDMYEPKNFFSNSLDIDLNKKYLLSLGNSTEIFHDIDIDNIEFILYQNNENLLFQFFCNTGSKDTFITAKKMLPSTIYFEINSLSITQRLYYLNAERIGPRLLQDIERYKFKHCGWQGENTIAVLSDLEYGFDVSKKRFFPDTENPLLRSQTNNWMRFVVPDIKIDFEAFKDINKTRVSFDKRNPYNVGFGISYILPIIVSGLIAEEGSMLIIENPEAHLHPYGQSKMGQFLAMVAASGVQVIVETHSEHLINGMRVSAVTDVIPHDAITINFFTKQEKEHEVMEISINERGELSEYPFGFFDQALHDQSTIIKANRAKQAAKL